MRITHESYRAAQEVDRAVSIPAALRQELEELNRTHPITEVRVESYDHTNVLYLKVVLADPRAAMQFGTGWTPGNTLRHWKPKLDRLRPQMDRLADDLLDRPIKVERCSAIIAAGHMDGNAFHRAVAAAMPIVDIPQDGKAPALRPLYTQRPEGCTVTIPQVSGRDLRVQVKAVVDGMSIVDRTITFERDVVLPATVMNALNGMPLDGIVEGTPFDGCGVLLAKGWRNGNGKGARLSVMAQSDLLSLEEAVLLIDRIRRPLPMAA